MILVVGSIDRRAGSEETNLIVNEIVPLADAWQKPVKHVTLRFAEPNHDATTLDRLAEILRRHPGSVPLRLVLDLIDGRRVLMEADRHAVAWTPQFQAEVSGLLGPGMIRAGISIPRTGGSRSRDDSGRGDGRRFSGKGSPARAG